MHISSIEIKNVRSIGEFSLRLNPAELAGWHVVLGANGSGKSSVIRSLAAALIGPAQASALNQVWMDWQRQGCETASISIKIEKVQEDDSYAGGGRPPTSRSFDIKVALNEREGSDGQRDLEADMKSKNLPERSVWSKVEGRGWFSASFGPFRRFTGGDVNYERLFFSSPRLAGHLSAFNEAVALTEGLRWLTNLKVSSLSDPPGRDARLLKALVDFINDREFLLSGARIDEITPKQIFVRDANHALISTELLSDGFRSLLSMMLELIRQLTISYGLDTVISHLSSQDRVIGLSGVVAIDEVDAHLHPDWQAKIGPWLTSAFPRIQFIVTTHSPIVCRSAKSIWWLPRPGGNETPRRIVGPDLLRLTEGSILDAYGTQLFGANTLRSEASKQKLQRLAALNQKELFASLSKEEETELNNLRMAMPSRELLIDDAEN